MEMFDELLLLTNDWGCSRRVPPLTHLPDEPLLRIFEMVVSHSLEGFFCIKLCCKRFAALVENQRIYVSVSLDKLPLFQLPAPCPSQLSFIESCENFGNPESLYRRGLSNYCTGYDVLGGVLDLMKAKDMGFGAASYALCVFLLFSHDIERKLGAVLEMNDLKNNPVHGSRVVSYRLKLFRLLNNPLLSHMLLLHFPFTLCPGIHAAYDGWCTNTITEDALECMFCSADVDVAWFSTIFPQIQL